MPTRPHRRAHAPWRLALALCASALVMGCAPVRVTTVVTPEVDWSAFRTYALVPPPEARTEVQVILEKEIGDEFALHGFRPAPLGESDLLVVAQGRTETAQRQIWAESPGGCCVVQSYTAGTLLIEVFESKGGTRVWRGQGEVDLQKATDKEIDEATERAVRAVMKEFPTVGDAAQ